MPTIDIRSRVHQSLLVVLSLSLLGILFELIALCTPAWQTCLVVEDGVYKQGGLLTTCETIDCNVNGCDGAERCEWSLFSVNYDTELLTDRRYLQSEADSSLIQAPNFYGWQKNFLHMLLIGLTSSIIAIAMVYIMILPLGQDLPNWNFICAIVMCLCALLTALHAIIVTIAFFVQSQKLAYSVYVGLADTYRKYIGYSYILHIIATVFFILALCAAIYGAVKVRGMPRLALSRPWMLDGERAPELYRTSSYYSAMNPIGYEGSTTYVHHDKHRYSTPF